MLARLPSRTGATVRIATATAIWASTAALTGACRRSSRACRMSCSGSFVTRDQTSSVSTHRIRARFFGVIPSSRCCSSAKRSVSEPPEGIVIEAADRMRKGNEPAAEIDGIGRGDLPILAPIAVEDLFGDIGMDQRAQ